MKLIIGLTGLIGSGKSVVADQFARLGVDIIDTDKIAHDITSVNGIAMVMILQQFGKNYVNIDGSLNRDAMRNLVFQNKTAKIQLEKILHPLIYAQSKLQIVQSNSPYVMVIVPLLFKALHYLSLIHRSLFVNCNEDLLISRVMHRNNFTQAQVMSILNQQTPAEIQLSLCDDTISNNDNLQALYNNVLELDQKYRNLSRIFT